MLLPLMQAAKDPAKQAMAGAAVAAVQERLPLKLRKAAAALLPKGYQGDEGDLMGCKSLLLHLRLTRYVCPADIQVVDDRPTHPHGAGNAGGCSAAGGCYVCYSVHALMRVVIGLLAADIAANIHLGVIH